MNFPQFLGQNSPKTTFGVEISQNWLLELPERKKVRLEANPNAAWVLGRAAGLNTYRLTAPMLSPGAEVLGLPEFGINAPSLTARPLYGSR